MSVWVAGYHRRLGLAAELVNVARARWPIESIAGPLNTQRTAAHVATRIAPDLPITSKAAAA